MIKLSTVHQTVRTGRLGPGPVAQDPSGSRSRCGIRRQRRAALAGLGPNRASDPGSESLKSESNGQGPGSGPGPATGLPSPGLPGPYRDDTEAVWLGRALGRASAQEQ